MCSANGKRATPNPWQHSSIDNIRKCTFDREQREAGKRKKTRNGIECEGGPLKVSNVLEV